MSLGDIVVREPKDLSSQAFQVAAGTTEAIVAGEPVVRTAGTPEVALGADGIPVSDTDEFVGIAATTSNETAAVAGTVDVFVLTGGEILEVKAEDASAVDTQAKINLLVNDNKLFALTGSAWTVDETSATSALNGLSVIGGNPTKGTLYLLVKSRVTMVGSKL